MSIFRTEAEAKADFEREARLRIEETRGLWSTFASTRGLRFAASVVAILPILEGRIDGTDVRLAAVGSFDLGFRTLATAQAKVSQPGEVRVAPHGASLLDDLAGLLRKGFFEDAELDHALVVKASSHDFATTLLDARVIQTVRALAPGSLHFSYLSGVIAVEWAGVERDFTVLDDVLDLLAYLGRQGSEVGPYR